MFGDFYAKYLKGDNIPLTAKVATKSSNREAERTNTKKSRTLKRKAPTRRISAADILYIRDQEPALWALLKRMGLGFLNLFSRRNPEETIIEIPMAINLHEQLGKASGSKSESTNQAPETTVKPQASTRIALRESNLKAFLAGHIDHIAKRSRSEKRRVVLKALKAIRNRCEVPLLRLRLAELDKELISILNKYRNAADLNLLTNSFMLSLGLRVKQGIKEEDGKIIDQYKEFKDGLTRLLVSHFSRDSKAAIMDRKAMQKACKIFKNIVRLERKYIVRSTDYQRAEEYIEEAKAELENDEILRDYEETYYVEFASEIGLGASMNTAETINPEREAFLAVAPASPLDRIHTQFDIVDWLNKDPEQEYRRTKGLAREPDSFAGILSASMAMQPGPF